jgi:hypothetical protein
MLDRPEVAAALAAGPANYLAASALIHDLFKPGRAGSGQRIGSLTESNLLPRPAIPEDAACLANDSLNRVTESEARQLENNAPEATSEKSSAASLEPIENSSLPDDGCITELSGALYLVNVMRALNLHECLAESWQPFEPINTWELVEGLARSLLGNADGAQRDDPIWMALAGLAGREPSQALGANFTAARQYDLPRAWLRHWPTASTDQYFFSVSASRLHIWSQSGYVLARRDCPNDNDARARDILGKYLDGAEDVSLVSRPAGEVPLANLNGPFTECISHNFRDWLALALPYIRRRLAHSLNIEADQVGKELLQHRGRLYVTRMHVDVKLPLAGISIAVRRAGLDVDPGWVPELGRIVKFHYD